MSKMLRAVALVSVVALLFAACGDDDEPTTDVGQEQPEAAEEANQEFCDAYVAAQAAVIGASSGGPTDEIPGLLDEVEATAPEEVSDTVSTFIPQVRDALETQDESVFESEEFQAADEELDTFVEGSCAFESIAVSAVDYAFEGIPSSIPAGNVTIKWTNDGEEVHEMLLVRFKDDSTKLEDLLELSEKEAEKKLDFVNGFFGEPGTVDTETVPLPAGRYAVACFIPVGATDLEALEKVDGPPHVTKGMSAEFTVQ